ncbi:hypothetical protein V7S43_010874 [Phytophthora oleae]|uniref:Cyclic nucleotide-binding domain-containing protein n=1 Tax=Phytophthora oleae TaxID=2107226 RepID=A0ABD3FC31_9STRA
MIVGAGVFAYGITNVVSLFQQLYESDTAYRRDMDQINDFMQDRMLPRALRDKVRANTFHWRKAARGENKERDRAIVERMASVIRTKVADRFCEDMMPKKMPFLAGCSAEFIHDLYLRMRVQCYLPGEDIISQGDYGSEMYFLFVGHAQVLLGLTKVALFGPNTCFGEFSIANPRKPRLATIQALDFCETHCIDREQILRVLLSHPITLRSARQLATLRSRKALTLIYESGGKSRTLLQGLAMMWRAEGVEAVLPAGVGADGLPFLQEFAATPRIARRSSAISSSGALSIGNAQLQLHHLHLQQHVEPNHVLHPQPLVANTSTPTVLIPQHLAAISTGSGRRSSSVLDPTVALTATQGLLSAPSSSSPSPSHQRGRNGTIRLPKINTDESIRTDLPPTEKETPTTRQGSPLRRLKSATSIANGSPLVLPETQSPQPPVDRLELLLTEIRNVASRQNELEQQLRAMMERPQPKPESLARVPSVGMLGDRFDEQHWIDDHAPPLVRQRTHRHSLTLPLDGDATEKPSHVERNRT